MGKGLTAAQRKAVAASDPSTGRVAAGAAVCAALVAAGLAVPHGRAGLHYLTPEGRRVRAELAMRAGGQTAGEGPEAAAGAGEVEADRGRFVADDGSGAVLPGAGRVAEVAAAWEGLRQIRAVLGDGAAQAPAAWERERPVHAVALALEAAGVPPHRAGEDGAAGYRVRSSAHPGLVEVTWSGAAAGSAALARVASLLGPLGWQATEHRARGGAPFLLVSPRHA
ncbi:hypothetical protein RVR_979 [Actinacidiphila reveromycinica]|uniref:Uncharacterized protein n=1 Tax=Actinacidiphila reveromycinica TaxID=659352 RepID=A0A7U3VLU8_9ACTN|nr:hypothetical protein [Streptomyces sp. SN-593]BBA95915.1 hypothetical protein RVR_979 [Streptomyces sp. SN-593]